MKFTQQTEKKKKQGDCVYANFSINQIIQAHDLGPKLKEDFLSEFVEFREFSFFSFDDNIFLIGFYIFLEFRLHTMIQSIEDIIGFVSEILTPLINENGFPNKLCDKFLGKTLNMLFIQQMKEIFEKIQNLEGFVNLLDDELNFKEKNFCEVLFKILTYEILTKKICDRKVPLAEDLKNNKKKIEDFLLNDNGSILNYESKYILNALCELCFILLDVITYDTANNFRIIENFPSWREVTGSNPNTSPAQKNIIIFNDSIYKIYILDKMMVVNRSITQRQLERNFIFKKEKNSFLQASRISSISPIKDNDSNSNYTSMEIEKQNSNKKSPQNDQKLDNVNKEILCIGCAGRLVLDHYNKLDISFLIQCEKCQKEICSIHKEAPSNCLCFCKKCNLPMQKQMYLKRSPDFGYGDDCYEIIQCKKCSTMRCFCCEKQMKTYEDICDCQCQICFKKILVKFENKDVYLDKCLECTQICVGCFVKKDKTKIFLTPCKKCAQNFCRVCVNDFLLSRKEITDKKNNNEKKSVVNNENKLTANNNISFICKFCQ